MDPFRLLTQGANFHKKSALFKQKKPAADDDGDDLTGPAASTSRLDAPLPAALDFFNVGGARSADADGADNGKGKRKREDRQTEAVAPRTLPTLTNRLNLTGRAAPTPLPSLQAFLDEHTPPTYIVRNLAQMGITEMSEVGRGAAAVMMAGRDLVALAPTGSGKTLSYLVPLLTLLRQPASALPEKTGGPRALLLAPTRELALQIQNECAKLTIGRKWRVVVLSKANESSVKEGVDILIATPMRLTQTLKGESPVSLATTTHVILDEADRLLDATFLPVVDEVLSHCTSPDLKRYLFTATLPSSLEEIARGLGAGDGIRVVVGLKDAATTLIDQTLSFTGTETGKLLALRTAITSGQLTPPTLIFVQSISRANDLFHELVYDGIHVDVIHSERTPAERERVVKEFREGTVWVLICTELMSRGMDFRGVDLVVNYDFPTSVQSYVHRIGRTGRAGRPGKAITYFTNEDAPYLKMIANVMRQSGCEVPEWMLALKNPSKKERKQVKRRPVERTDVRTVGGSGLGRQQAQKKREMVEGSKRRKTKPDGEREGHSVEGGAGGGGKQKGGSGLVDLAE